MDNHLKDMQRQAVTEFYRGKSVFVTGGAGFLGKVLIEKLLYNCPEIEKIFILMRNKNGISTDERLEQMLNSPVFSRIHNEKPQSLKKIQHISGDLTAPNMGLTEEQMCIVQKVSIVFHLAATVKFNEPLGNAVLVNVEGTREVIRVFKHLNNLQSFIHISTAFSNPNEEIIEEIVYPPPRAFDEVYNYIENENDHQKNLKNFLNGRPNTYTFTKAMAENVVAKESGEMPVAIIRPSIVTPALKEPLRGWVDNWLGVTTFLYAIAKGWTRLLYGKKHNIIDLIPVDYVVNLMIVAATRSKRSKDIPVYNICSSSSNPIDFSLLERLCLKESAAQRFNDFPLLGIIYIKSPTLIRLLSILLEVLPAYLADIWTKLTGKRNRSFSYVKMQGKQSLIRESMMFFASRSWMIKSVHARELFASLSSQDQLLFPCDPVNINWSNYIPAYFHGMKTFLVNARVK